MKTTGGFSGRESLVEKTNHLLYLSEMTKLTTKRKRMEELQLHLTQAETELQRPEQEWGQNPPRWSTEQTVQRRWRWIMMVPDTNTVSLWSSEMILCLIKAASSGNSVINCLKFLVGWDLHSFMYFMLFIRSYYYIFHNSRWFLWNTNVCLFMSVPRLSNRHKNHRCITLFPRVRCTHPVQMTDTINCI